MLLRCLASWRPSRRTRTLNFHGAALFRIAIEARRHDLDGHLQIRSPFLKIDRGCWLIPTKPRLSGEVDDEQNHHADDHRQQHAVNRERT
jgi:hypothetical protein